MVANEKTSPRMYSTVNQYDDLLTKELKKDRTASAADELRSQVSGVARCKLLIN